LLDVIMPGMDGIETCRAIRNITAFQETPVLMLTGADGLDYIRRAFNAGATDFINKTSNLGFVSQRIRYALRNHDVARQLCQHEQQLVQAQRVAGLGYFRLEVNSGQLVLSEEACRILNADPQKFTSTLKGYLDLVHARDRDGVKLAINAALYEYKPFNIDHRFVQADGSEGYVHAQGEVIYNEDRDPVSMLCTVQDITERKRAEALIQHQAFYDSLTDLCNRRLFQERLTHAMAMAHREEKLLAVCFFDLDTFKKINDNLGHAVGDELLRSVAKRLRSTMRRGDLVARISGDEFAIAIEGLNTVGELEMIVEKLRRRLAEPYRIRGHKVIATASIGIALYPLDSADREAMLLNADAAMYRAKELGGNCYCYYTHDMNDKTRRRLDMEDKLRRSLDNNEMQVYYQPQINAGTGRIVGVEALLRWNHPDMGLLPPAKFIAIAEETGMIFPIGDWVLRTACQQIMNWKRQGYGDLRLAVNMSGRQFAQDNVVARVKSVFIATGFNPKDLTIEINEKVAMQNVLSSGKTINEFKAMGVRLAIDDFGLGHSSMNHLQQLSIDALNIDRSFVMRIAGREQDGAMARAIIALAHSMDFEVTAEGVENQTHVEFLKRHKCDELQGHHFSPPIPAEEVPALLQAGIGQAC
jgi:diguanylate cyclase (GGDEF)-like protein